MTRVFTFIKVEVNFVFVDYNNLISGNDKYMVMYLNVHNNTSLDKPFRVNKKCTKKDQIV